MRGRIAHRAFALGCAGLIVVGVAGCNQNKPGDNSSQSDLKIVEQVQIDQNGTEVKPDASAGPAADPAGDGKAVCPPIEIAMAGALTGEQAALGINIKDGAQLAVDKHNAANPGCQVQLQPFDTEGKPDLAKNVAPRIIDDAQIIGLIGPAFSGETNATGSVFDQAGLVSTTASATRVDLSNNNWKTFFRGLANDGVQGPSVANYLKNTVGYKKICVVDDKTDYGLGLAQTVRATLGPLADAGCNISTEQDAKDFSAAVTQIKDKNPDAVFYAGYYAGAALLTQQLKDGGVTATFVSADGSKDPQYVKSAGASAKGAVLSCPCGPAPKAFADEYQAKFNMEPSTYSTEGYDLATILLKGIDAGKITRPDLLEYVRTYQGQGIARKYQWTDKGELTSNLIWIYRVQ